jgi:hypothetical protein
VADLTRRFFADSPLSYALAAIALVDYARANPGADFAFGPLDSHAMAETGLTITGTDLDGPAGVLERIEGMAEDKLPSSTVPISPA